MNTSFLPPLPSGAAAATSSASPSHLNGAADVPAVSAPLSSALSSALSPDADPYVLLEEDTDEVLAWQTEADRRARVQLKGAAAFRSFEALVRADFVDLLTFHAPRPVRGRWFFRGVPDGATQPVVSVSDSPHDTGRVLFDLAQLPVDDPQLTDMQPSPDARRVLLVVKPGGESMQSLVFVVDARDADPAATIEFAVTGPVGMPAWLPDGSGFLFAGLPLGIDVSALPPAPGLRIFEQRLDAALSRTVMPLAHASAMVMPQVSPDGRYAVISEDQAALHPTYIRRLAGATDGSDWEPFLDASYGRVKGTVVGDEFIAVTTDGAPRGRIVAIPLRTPRDRDTWRQILPGDGAVPVSVTPAGGKLVVAETVQGNGRLRVVWLNGNVEHTLRIGPDGAVGKFAFGFVTGLIDDLVWADGNIISFVHSSLKRPPVAWTYDVRTGQLATAGVARASLKGVSVTPAALGKLQEKVQDDTVRAGDVSYQVFARDDLEGPGPTIVTGYGGFNVHWLPCWSNLAAAWVRAGGRWVHAHLRGGGEFGEAFWRAGRMARKGNGFEDLFAIVDDVIARGLCTPRQLGLFGSSNGSLFVSAAVALRPDRFAAGVAQVPIADLLRSAKDPATLGIVRSEYGDPLVEAEAAWIRAWSPYHRLPAGRRLPALLVDAGAQDPTCRPWHARKLAAAVAGRGTNDSGPVLLRVRPGVGHNVMAPELAIERDAETLSFFAQQLGLRP